MMVNHRSTYLPCRTCLYTLSDNFVSKMSNLMEIGEIMVRIDWLHASITTSYKKFIAKGRKKSVLHALQLTFDCLKSMFVLIVRWLSFCTGLALLPSGAFGICSEPCINLLNAYSCKSHKFVKIYSLATKKSEAWQTNLLFCYINRFVQNNPNGTFPASRMCCRPFISHVCISVWYQWPQWNMSNRCGRACKVK